MSHSEMSLDALYAQARQQHFEARRKAEAREKQKKFTEPAEAPLEPSGLFANPENWVQTRGLALVHRATQTLLGNFWELRHKTVKDARRLIRAPGPIVVEGVELVDFGLPSAAVPLSISLRAEVSVAWEGPVVLGEPEVSAPRVALDVVYYQGAIAAARLREAAMFSEGNQALELPAGVDILPCMTRESKIGLRDRT